MLKEKQKQVLKQQLLFLNYDFIMIKKRPATVLGGSLPVTATGEPDAGV